MTDNARIQRLTELARKASCWRELWQVRAPRLFITPSQSGLLATRSGCDEMVLLDTRGDVDALEAALCVLAGEPPTSKLDRMREQVLGYDFGGNEQTEVADPDALRVIVTPVLPVDPVAEAQVGELLAAARGEP
jgi:hypothetical protein